MKNKQLIGAGTALVTPFDAKGKIDYKAFEKLIDHNIKGGIDYLVLQGTTGETVTLSKQERIESFTFALDYIAKRVPMVIGIGGNNTTDLLKELDWFDLSKVAAILSASPAYNKPSQEGIYQHYQVLSKHSPAPIILYNVPGRTASNVSVETTVRIAKDFKNVVAVKEASGNIAQISKMIQHKPKDFLVISGDDGLTLPTIALGGHGVISVISNVLPKSLSKLTHLSLAGKFEEAAKIHHSLTDLIDLLFAENNPAGIKAALEIAGIGKANLRLPLVKVSEGLHDKIKKCMKVLG